MFQGKLKGVSRAFQFKFKEVVPQGSFMKGLSISRKISKKLIGVSNVSMMFQDSCKETS